MALYYIAYAGLCFHFSCMGLGNALRLISSFGYYLIVVFGMIGIGPSKACSGGHCERN